MRSPWFFLFIVLLPFFVSGEARAQAGGVIEGRVVSSTGEPAQDATVTLINVRRRSPVDAAGTFSFGQLPPGDYLIEARSPRYGIVTERIRLAAGETARRDLVLDLLFHAEPITVTTAPGARGLDEVAQPVQVIGGRELAAQREPTLGETLAGEPGVSSTYFGPGASRPVIRGLGGDRVRILEGGIGSGDASSTSPDHAISHDPLSTERIEIVRGPGTLLYGSSAIGGVVNVIDDRIPRYALETPLTGTVELRGGTVADERSGAASLSGGLGALAWHLGGLARETDDYAIPGFAEEAHEDEEQEGVRGLLANSAIETRNLSGGVSVVGQAGFLGVAFTRFDDTYGIPGHGHEPEELAPAQGEEEVVTIDLDQRRFDLEGELNRPVGAFSGLRLRLGTADYEHVELEGAETGTVFTNEAWEARLEAPHRPWGDLTGALGLQLSGRDFVAIGEEAFVPPTDTDVWAVFAFEELTAGSARLQAGLRFERQKIAAVPEAGAVERTLDGISASAGVVWSPAPAWSVSGSLARAVKLPNAEELFSNGPHLATNAFEIGDPDLDNETSVGIDLGIGRTEGRVTGELSFFLNRFSDFIFERRTGEIEDGLDVFRYTQDDARFTGAEAHVDVELLHDEPHHVALELIGDYVRAELVDEDEPLPRIPPVRLGVGIHYQGDALWGRVETRRVTEQDRVAPLEEPTEGYTFLNATLGYRFFSGGLVHDLILRGSNLTDAEARNHVSFLKDVAPLPGRDLSLAYRLSF